LHGGRRLNEYVVSVTVFFMVTLCDEVIFSKNLKWTNFYLLLATYKGENLPAVKYYTTLVISCMIHIFEKAPA